MVHFERPPAPDDQKRMHEDLLDRLVVAIRSGILSGVRDFGLENSREVTRLVARTSTRLARDLRPFAQTKAIKDAMRAPKAAKNRKSRRARRKSA